MNSLDIFDTQDPFVNRHIGTINPETTKAMLKELQLSSLDELIDKVIPNDIRINDFEAISEPPLSQNEYLEHIREVAEKNLVFKSYIGLGYYNNFLPPVIQRCLLENPGWYTQYTPYQAEISQGRLESLLNFQTMVSDLTGFPVANASLLDEGTAAAEGMIMAYRLLKDHRNKFFVSDHLFPQSIEVIKTRALAFGLDLEIGDFKNFLGGEDYFGAIIQYPTANGEVVDFENQIKEIKKNNLIVIAATDILSLTLLKPPAEWGADIAVGSTQRLGVPLGYGGPHAAFISTKDEYRRLIPGRIIGVAKDKSGQLAYRMSLQTREQHIRREKATSNICTAQALLANISAMYVIYHGKEGIKKIAEAIYHKTMILATHAKKLGFEIENKTFFDTITLSADREVVKNIHEFSLKNKVNFRKFSSAKQVGISLDETVSKSDLELILKILYQAKNKGNIRELSSEKGFQLHQVDLNSNHFKIPEKLTRKSAYLNHPIFNKIKSETQMLRYLNFLEKKDLSLNTSMIPLGSCTMKLNAAAEMIPLSFEHFSQIHPFVPLEQTLGYREIFAYLEKTLERITGFDSTSLQPNSGAQGEYAGLLTIKYYLESIGEGKRNIILIPSSAHGTNPASAIMAGMQVKVIQCLENGDIDLENLKAKVKEYSKELAGLMITYPSTHGVFEPKVKEICETIHEHGGQVYMDGANLNAQVGYTHPAIIGADVCHINLHKTFSIPHGGGGLGVGPIVVRKHLAPFLPGHALKPIAKRVDKAVASSPWGSASILIISYAYLKLLGNEGIKKSSAHAILNANYIKSRLEKHYSVLFRGESGYVAHELIIDVREFVEKIGISAEDIAKRLMDFGFHAPTMSWPVANTLMIEPTESEDKEEIDRFCDALIVIRQEIENISSGKISKTNNPLKNSPHSLATLTREWVYPYSIDEAVFPLPYIKNNKFWPSLERIDNVYGDRNFYCTCPPIESYE